MSEPTDTELLAIYSLLKPHERRELLETARAMLANHGLRIGRGQRLVSTKSVRPL